MSANISDPVDSAVNRKSMAYGIRTVRQIKECKRPSDKQSKRIVDAHTYFTKNVDPIISKCITYLLCVQPEDVPASMLDFLIKWKNGNEVDPLPLINLKKPRRDQKVLLATTVGPIVNKLVNRIAKPRPENVLEFFCNELSNMITVEKCFLEDKEPIVQPLTVIKSPQKSATVAKQELPVASATSAEAIVSNILNKSIEHQMEPKHFQIVMLGLGGSGKSSVLNVVQGKHDIHVKATVGFRPIALELAEGTKVSFFDLGGGKKIREIWSQYYHDVHAVIFVVDAANGNADERVEVQKAFQAATNDPLLQGKPTLVLANKQDLPGALTAEQVQAWLGSSDNGDSSAISITAAAASHDFKTLECSTTPLATSSSSAAVDVAVSTASPEDVEEEPSTLTFDPRVEAGIEWLLSRIQVNYPTLNTRVTADVKRRAAEDAKKRLERERKVLRNKIACAFVHIIDPSKLPENTPAKPEDVFTEDDGLAFLAAEVGEEVARLEPLGKQVAAMIGYQKTALQIVGGLKAPISKKKVPMTWPEIQELVLDLRSELGLQ